MRVEAAAAAAVLSGERHWRLFSVEKMFPWFRIRFVQSPSDFVFVHFQYLPHLPGVFGWYCPRWICEKNWLRSLKPSAQKLIFDVFFKLLLWGCSWTLVQPAVGVEMKTLLASVVWISFVVYFLKKHFLKHFSHFWTTVQCFLLSVELWLCRLCLQMMSSVQDGNSANNTVNVVASPFSSSRGSGEASQFL